MYKWSYCYGSILCALNRVFLLSTHSDRTCEKKKNGFSLPISAFTSTAFTSLFISFSFKWNQFALFSLKIMHFIIAVFNQVNRKFFSLFTRHVIDSITTLLIRFQFFINCNHMNDVSLSLSRSFLLFHTRFQLFSIQLDSSFASCTLKCTLARIFCENKKSGFQFGSFIGCKLTTMYVKHDIFQWHY